MISGIFRDYYCGIFGYCSKHYIFLKYFLTVDYPFKSVFSKRNLYFQCVTCISLIRSIKPYVHVCISVGGLVVVWKIQLKLHIIIRTTKLDLKIINLTLLIIWTYIHYLWNITYTITIFNISYKLLIHMYIPIIFILAMTSSYLLTNNRAISELE